MAKIYTRQGDNGKTSLVGGIRIDKDACRLEAYGTIDELSSHIGLLIAYINNDNEISQSEAETEKFLEHIQCLLFSIGAYLATDTATTQIPSSALINEEEITLIEQQIDLITPTLPCLKSFVLPGGTIPASQCHVCRTVCRRAERQIVTLSKQAGILPHYLRYINRLSDYLFVLARKLNNYAPSQEKTWVTPCK